MLPFNGGHVEYTLNILMQLWMLLLLPDLLLIIMTRRVVILVAVEILHVCLESQSCRSEVDGCCFRCACCCCWLSLPMLVVTATRRVRDFALVMDDDADATMS